MRNPILMRACSFALALVAAGVGWNAALAESTTYSGEAIPLGNGTVNTYVTLAQDRTPLAIGVRMSKTALDGLPEHPNNTGRCFDLNSDGTIEAGTECLGDYETVLEWPPEAQLANLPFRWMMLNWNAHGHPPQNVYTLPHFDIHFYMVEKELIDSIRTGSCGEFVDCDDFKRASIPVPALYLPTGHTDVGAVVPMMGNHLINLASPEFATPPQRFTHTLIYGAYDGRIIFIEPMITREYLLSGPDSCTAIAQPPAWAKAAYYPTKYCIRDIAQEAAVTVSLEGFVNRKITLETEVETDNDALL